MTEYLIRWESAPLAWVLYRSATPMLLWQQVADNGAIRKEYQEDAMLWAHKMIQQEGDRRYTLYGPGYQVIPTKTD
jgi:hypothetical protein